MKKKLHFILLIGPLGAGKSTTASLLKTKLKRTAILQIEDVRGLVSDFSGSSEDHDLAWKIIYRMCDEYLRNGVSVLVEQTACSQEVVNQLLHIANEHKCNIGFYYLQAPKEIRLKRISQRDKPKASETLIENNTRKYENTSFPNATTIDTTTMSPDQTAEFILKDLAEGESL